MYVIYMDKSCKLYLIGIDIGQQIILDVIHVYSVHWNIKEGMATQLS